MAVVVFQFLSRVWLCNPMNCRMPGFLVLHHLPEFAQNYVHLVSDAIQPSHPLPHPSATALSLLQHQGLFQWICSSHQVAKVLEFQFRISPSNEYSQGWFPLGLTSLNFLEVQGTLESSPARQFESISPLLLSLLYDPTLTSMYDYWKNCSFD